MRLSAWVGDKVSYAKAVWKAYSEDNGALFAAAASFYDFLSLFPLLLAAIGILGLIISPSKAESMLTGAIGSFLPGGQIGSTVKQVVHGSSAATGIGLIVLLWSGTTAVVMLEQIINIAWDIKEKRSFFKLRAVAVVVLIIAGILVAASFGITAGINTLRTFRGLHQLTWFWNVLGYLIPLIISIVLFTFLYKVLPYAPVRLRTALTGGIFAGILFEIAKQIYTWYVITFASHNHVYGSLGGVILLLVWINYTAIITILGAEFAIVWAERHQPAPEQEAQEGH